MSDSPPRNDGGSPDAIYDNSEETTRQALENGGFESEFTCPDFLNDNEKTDDSVNIADRLAIEGLAGKEDDSVNLDEELSKIDLKSPQETYNDSTTTNVIIEDNQDTIIESTQHNEIEQAVSTQEYQDGDVSAGDVSAGDESQDEFGEFDDFEDFQQVQSDSVEVSMSSPIGRNVSNASPSMIALTEADFSDSVQTQSKVLSILNAYWDKSPIKGSTLNETAVHTNSCSPPSTMSYFSERSLSLWNQLAMEPRQLNPVDWKRSSIRRLFLISLGVPLDLDEILPKKVSKRLILPAGSRQAAAGDSHDNKNVTSTGNSGGNSSKQQNQLHALVDETDLKVGQWHQLSIVSAEALQGMDDSELDIHMQGLNVALKEANRIHDRWVSSRDKALKDKEAFEGVIESLLEYAQRLRK